MENYKTNSFLWQRLVMSKMQQGMSFRLAFAMPLPREFAIEDQLDQKAPLRHGPNFALKNGAIACFQPLILLHSLTFSVCWFGPTPRETKGRSNGPFDLDSSHLQQ